jgi:hypothetical protein
MILARYGAHQSVGDELTLTAPTIGLLVPYTRRIYGTVFGTHAVMPISACYWPRQRFAFGRRKNVSFR